MAGAVMLDGCKKDEAANDALSVIASRTSVRCYDASREVTDEMVETLLRAAMSAPTAVNLQPWEFIVVRDKATLDRFYSFLVGGFDLKGKKAALIASCGEPTVDAMDGLVFSFKKTTGLLGLEDVGHKGLQVERNCVRMSIYSRFHN